MIDLTKVSNLKFEDIYYKDCPDFCDAFLSSAEYLDRDMTEEELNELNENYREWIHEKLLEYI